MGLSLLLVWHLYWAPGGAPYWLRKISEGS